MPLLAESVFLKRSYHLQKVTLNILIPGQGTVFFGHIPTIGAGFPLFPCNNQDIVVAGRYFILIKAKHLPPKPFEPVANHRIAAGPTHRNTKSRRIKLIRSHIKTQRPPTGKTPVRQHPAEIVLRNKPLRFSKIESRQHHSNINKLCLISAIWPVMIKICSAMTFLHPFISIGSNQHNAAAVTFRPPCVLLWDVISSGGGATSTEWGPCG